MRSLLDTHNDNVTVFGYGPRVYLRHFGGQNNYLFVVRRGFTSDVAVVTYLLSACSYAREMFICD